MKGIQNIRRVLFVIAAVAAAMLTVVTGCGQTADPAAPSDGAESVSVTGDEGAGGFPTGDAAAGYDNLPPAYKTALTAYADYYGVSPDLARSAIEDKIEQWGDNAVPLDELIGAERAQRFRERGSLEEHADLLLSGYVYLLISDIKPDRRNELMRELAPDPVGEANDAMGPGTDPLVYSLTQLDPPPYEKVLTQTALDRFKGLGPRIKQALFDDGRLFKYTDMKPRMKSRDMATWLTDVEMFLLRAEPGFDVPELETHLTGDALDTFKALSDEGQAFAAEMFREYSIQTAVRSVEGMRYTQADPFDPLGYLSDDQLADEAASIIEWTVAVENHLLANS